MHHTTLMTQPMEVNDNETGAVMNMDKASGRCHTISHCQPKQSASHCQPKQSARHCQPKQSAKHCQPKQSAKHCQPKQSATHCQPKQSTLDMISQPYSTRNTQQDTLNYTPPLSYTQLNTPGQTHLAKETVPVQRA